MANRFAGIIAVAIGGLPAVADAQVYTTTATAAVWTDLADIPGIDGVTPYTATEAANGVAADIPIGFPFEWMGRTVESMHVSTHGYISFVNEGMNEWTNDLIPDPIAPNDYIAPWWDDLVAPSAQFGTYGTIGEAPERIFVIEARGLAQLTASTALHWQIWLYEGSAGKFEVRLDGDIAIGSATSGFEGPGAEVFGRFNSCTPGCAAPDFTTMLGQAFVTEFARSPELTAAGADFPRGAFPGQEVEGSIEIGNLAVDTASSVHWRLSLSTDESLDASDIVVAEGVADEISGRETATFPVTFSVPQTLASADYRLILEVDSDDAFEEVIEDDNVAVVDGFATAHDLTGLLVRSEDGANPGQPIQFELEVGHLGVPFSGDVEVTIHASVDAALDRADTEVTTVFVTLSGENPQTVVINGVLPMLLPGAYYAIATIDAGGAVDELSEDNNEVVSLQPFPTGSDIIASRVRAPNFVSAGDTIEIATTLSSGGVPYFGDVVYTLHFSADETLDMGDPIAARQTLRWEGERSVEDTYTMTWPAALAAGEYYVIATVDPEESIQEVDEFNNQTVTNDVIRNGHDFFALDVAVSETAEPGQAVEVSAQVRSVGVPYVGPLPYRIYLSADETYDPGDEAVFAGSVFLTGLSNASISQTFTLPTSVPVQSFHAVVVMDPDNTVVESNDANNAAVSATQVDVLGADLVLNAISGSPFSFLGMPYELSFTVENTAQAPAREFQVAIYLSDNDIIRVTDQRIYVTDPMTLEPGDSESITVSIDLSTITSTQTLWIGGIADVFSQVPESREGNNIRRIPHAVEVVHPIPDLSGTIIQTATQAAAGESIAITRVLRNEGVAPAPAFEYGYYLSSNPTISTDDISLGHYAASLDTGADDIAIDVLRLPSNVAAGSYFIGVLIDGQDLVREIDEENNQALGPEVEVYGAAIVFTTDRLPRATIGVRYEAVVYVQGAPLAVDWALAEGSLPDGLSLDADTGIVEGTPTAEGLFSFVLAARSGTAIAEKSFEIRVVSTSLPMAVATRSLPTAVVSRPYGQKIIATGGQPPYRWRTISPLPPGIELTEDGIVSGTPVAPGNFSLSVNVLDTLGESAGGSVEFHVVRASESIAIEQLALPIAEIDTEYCDPTAVRLTAVHGVPPYRWSLIGVGVEGVLLDGESGTLCGIPTKAGRFPLTVRVQDVTGMFDTALFFLTVDDGTALAISTTELPAAAVETAYEAQLQMIRGMAPLTWEILDGALPPGIALDAATGSLAGSPTEGGLFVFTVSVTDVAGRVAMAPLSIQVAEKAGLVDVDEGGCSCDGSGHSTTSGAAWVFLMLAVGWLLRPSRRQRTLGLPGGLVAAALMMVTSTAWAQDRVEGTPYLISRAPAAYQNLVGADEIFGEGADGDQATIALPFPFKFYDAVHGQVTVGVNGALMLGAGRTVSDTNVVPGTDQPNELIAVCWDDLVVGTGGAVSWKVEGRAPSRVAIFEWKNVDVYGFFSTGPRMNIQLRLYEGPEGKMSIQYGPVDTTTSMSATMAMEDPAGGRIVYFDSRSSPCTHDCDIAALNALEGTLVTLTQDPGIELVAVEATGPSLGFIGAPFEVSATAANLHRQPIGPFSAEVVISRNRDLSEALVMHTTEPMIFRGFERQSWTFEVTPPDELEEGEYFVGLVVDSSDAVEEVDETNNAIASQAVIRILGRKPDLSVAAVSVNTTMAEAGTPIDVAVRVRNSGSDPLTSAEISVMLSTNPAISAEDIELTRYSVDLDPRQVDTRTIRVTMPAELNSGQYWIGVFADRSGSVEELSESNNGLAAASPVSIGAAGLAIATGRLPNAYLAETYVARLFAIGAGPEYEWSITSGRLPMGLGLAERTGEIFGRASQEETQAIEVTVTSGDLVATQMLTLSVIDPRAPLTIVTRTVPQGVLGQEYAFQLLAAGGGVDGDLRWSAEGAPEGLTMSEDGVLVGSPRGEPGTYAMVVRLTDGAAMASRSFDVEISENHTLLIAPEILPTALYGEVYSTTLKASGGLPPLTWLISGGDLPDGILLGTDGELTGSAAVVRLAPFSFVVEVRDSAGGRDTNSFELQVDDESGFVIATAAALPAAFVGESYKTRILSEGGTPPIHWEVIGGRLPDGFTTTAIAETGELEIFGSGTSVSTHNLLIRAADSRGRVATRAFGLPIREAESTMDAAKDDDGGCVCVEPTGASSRWLLAAGALLLLARRRRRS